jgi:catechol 2,3-dioxygenase-like lactoylglutathione lyase family enzyme
MLRSVRRFAGLAVTLLAAAASAPVARADEASPRANVPLTVGHAVADLDRTLHFYRDVVGLELARPVDRHPRADPEIARLTGARGARVRTALLRVPNEPFLLELTEYTGVPRTAVQARHQDVGAPALTLSVKDAAAAFQALRDAGTPTMLPGGTIPSPTGDGLATVFVRDPDGYIVEFVHRTPTDWFTVPAPTVTDGPGMRYVIRGQIDLTMASDQQALSFYRDLLGFDINPGFPPLVGPNEHPVVPAGLAGLLGITPGSTWAAATGNCTAVTRCEYFEYDDPIRQLFNPPVQDPGAPFESIGTPDLRRLLRQITARGLPVVTPGGRPVRVHGTESILVRDPSGLLIRLEQLRRDCKEKRQ